MEKNFDIKHRPTRRKQKIEKEMSMRKFWPRTPKPSWKWSHYPLLGMKEGYKAKHSPPPILPVKVKSTICYRDFWTLSLKVLASRKDGHKDFADEFTDPVHITVHRCIRKLHRNGVSVWPSAASHVAFYKFASGLALSLLSLFWFPAIKQNVLLWFVFLAKMFRKLGTIFSLSKNKIYFYWWETLKVFGGTFQNSHR